MADEATRILREAGLQVIREDASLLRPERLDERFRVKVAVFLHFDGDKEDGVERSGAAFRTASHQNRTTLTAAEVADLGEKLLAAFKNQPN